MYLRMPKLNITYNSRMPLLATVWGVLRMRLVSIGEHYNGRHTCLGNNQYYICDINQPAWHAKEATWKRSRRRGDILRRRRRSIGTFSAWVSGTHLSCRWNTIWQRLWGRLGTSAVCLLVTMRLILLWTYNEKDRDNGADISWTAPNSPSA